MKGAVLEKIRGGLIVSCQALKDEPLYSSHIMSRMAYAAMLGGAVGIRANTVADITGIKTMVNLPMIGIIKEMYGDCDVYITPMIKGIDALIECGVDIIATDATKRMRPDRTIGKGIGKASYCRRRYLVTRSAKSGIGCRSMGGGNW